MPIDVRGILGDVVGFFLMYCQVLRAYETLAFVALSSSAP